MTHDANTNPQAGRRPSGHSVHSLVLSSTLPGLPVSLCFTLVCFRALQPSLQCGVSTRAGCSTWRVVESATNADRDEHGSGGSGQALLFFCPSPMTLHLISLKASNPSSLIPPRGVGRRWRSLTAESRKEEVAGDVSVSLAIRSFAP